MRLATATLTAVALLGGVGALVTTGSAAVVKPDQHFIGTVNGDHVNAVVYLVCPGPAQPGQTRHPAGGQYVATILVATGSGYTGDSARTVIARAETFLPLARFMRMVLRTTAASPSATRSSISKSLAPCIPDSIALKPARSTLPMPRFR